MCPEIAFRCIVGFDIMHFRRMNDLLILFTVRGKSDTSVEEYFQIGPYFFQGLLACFFKNTFD